MIGCYVSCWRIISHKFLNDSDNKITNKFINAVFTFKCIKADTQLLYSSDYPHWDFDLPSTIYDLPFLKEKAKRDILGGNAVKLFKLDIGKGNVAKVA